MYRVSLKRSDELSERNQREEFAHARTLGFSRFVRRLDIPTATIRSGMTIYDDVSRQGRFSGQDRSAFCLNGQLSAEMCANIFATSCIRGLAEM
jgi:hypothetical protein